MNAFQHTVTQNLRDAGCPEPQIGEFWRFWQEGRWKQSFDLLEKHRSQLLENCHREQKRIDCLDYLLYQLRQTHFSQQGS